MLNATIAAVRKQFGDVEQARGPVMGAEDFALISQLVPSFQLGIGSGAPGRNDRLHNSGYAPDEACIGVGVQALSRAALELLSRWRSGVGVGEKRPSLIPVAACAI